MASAIRYRLSSQIKFNIKAYLDREFVNRGLFTNIPSGTLFRPGGQRMDKLVRVNSKLYESLFDNWVYEPDASGVAGFPTIDASGVYIDNVFHARNTNPYQPEIDFAKGRVHFGSGVLVASSVSADFTFKNVLIDYVDSRASNRIFSNLKNNVDFTNNLTAPSGRERQLPLVVIDPQRRLITPHALGGAIETDNLVVFHVLSSNVVELDQIIDILTEISFRKGFNGVDFNETPILFTDNGDKASTFKSYTTMQNDVSLRLAPFYIQDAQIVEQFERFGVYYARVHWNLIIYLRGAG